MADGTGAVTPQSQNVDTSGWVDQGPMPKAATTPLSQRGSGSQTPPPPQSVDTSGWQDEIPQPQSETQQATQQNSTLGGEAQSAMQGMGEHLGDLANLPAGMLSLFKLNGNNALVLDAKARNAIMDQAVSEYHQAKGMSDKGAALVKMFDAMIPFLGPQSQAEVEERKKNPVAAAFHSAGSGITQLLGGELLPGLKGEPTGIGQASAAEGAPLAVNPSEAIKSAVAGGRGNAVASAARDVAQDTGVKVPITQGMQTGNSGSVIAEMVAKRAANLRGSQIPSDVVINEGIKQAADSISDQISSKPADPASWADAIHQTKTALGSQVRSVEDNIRSQNAQVPTPQLQRVQQVASDLAKQFGDKNSDYPIAQNAESSRAIQILDNFSQPTKTVQPIIGGEPYGGPVQVPKVMQVNDMLQKIDQLQKIAGDDNMTQGAILKLKTTISQAIRDTVGPDLANQWDSANKNYAVLSKQLSDTVGKKVYETATPSQLAKFLTSENASAIENPGILKNVMGDAKFGEVQRSIFQRLLEKNTGTDGIIDSEGLKNAWNKLGPAKQKAWFGPQASKIDNLVNAARTFGLGPVPEPLSGVAAAAPNLGPFVRAVEGAHNFFQVGRGITLELGHHAITSLSPEIVSKLVMSPQGADLIGKYSKAVPGSALRHGLAAQILYSAKGLDKSIPPPSQSTDLSQ